MPQNMTPNLLTSHHTYHKTSHLTTPYKISPHHILWHHATPHQITSYHITSHEITLYHATSHDLMSHVPHHITSHHATSLDIIPLYTKSHHITSDEDFITSLVITPYLIISQICKPVLSINFTKSQKLLIWMGGKYQLSFMHLDDRRLILLQFSSICIGGCSEFLQFCFSWLCTTDGRVS